MASGRPDDPLVLNDRVLHATFGGGVVTAVEGDRVTVAFDAVGYRILDMAAAARPGVLAREER